MSFKSFSLSRDFKPLTTAINETVTVTGSIFTTNANVKFYRNIASGSAAIDLMGSFETAYDSSPTSSLSSPLFDVTYGFATASAYNVASTATSSVNDKIKIYRQFANVLLGNPDSTFTINGVKQTEGLFLILRRSLMKDELKKGTVSLTVNSTAPAQYSASDQGAAVNFKLNPGGDYAPLKYNGTGSEVGQVWYNAGVIVLPPNLTWGTITIWSGSLTLDNLQSSASISQIVDGFRTHTEQVAFNNQTNLQSSIWFCRAFNDEFNYSSNPTFVDGTGLIRVTSGSNIQMTRTYITTVGIYDEADDLLAVGKANKPILKSPENEIVVRLRLDFAVLPIPLVLPSQLFFPSLFVLACLLFVFGSSRNVGSTISSFTRSMRRAIRKIVISVDHVLGWFGRRHIVARPEEKILPDHGPLSFMSIDG